MLWSLAVPRLPEICKDFPGRCYFPILTAFALLHLDGLSMRNELPITYSTRTQCRSPAVSCVEPDAPLWQRQVFACRPAGIFPGSRGLRRRGRCCERPQGPFRAGPCRRVLRGRCASSVAKGTGDTCLAGAVWQRNSPPGFACGARDSAAALQDLPGRHTASGSPGSQMHCSGPVVRSAGLPAEFLSCRRLGRACGFSVSLAVRLFSGVCPGGSSSCSGGGCYLDASFSQKAFWASVSLLKALIRPSRSRFSCGSSGGRAGPAAST